MKKLLFVLLMVLSLVISLPAQAAVEILADFTFDSEADYADGGNAKAVVSSGDPKWVNEYAGRTGVMYFDGNSGLSITKSDGSPVLTNVTELTVSFDAYYAGNSGESQWVFLAIPGDHSQNPWWSKHVGISETNSAIRLERPFDAGSDSNALNIQSITTNQWHHIEAHFTSGGMALYVDGDLKGSNGNASDLTSLLGSSSQILLGVGNWGGNISWYDPDYTGYIDNFQIKGEKSIRAALNPFNNFGGRKPSLYGSMTLKDQGSGATQERIVFPVQEGATITLPSEESLRNGFTLGGKTYILEGNQENPRKLIGWYNIANGKYYSVLNGDAKNVPLTGKNDVFYGDWIASSYDFLGTNTKPDDLITTADTSDFIDINVFDYSDLVNVNSMTVSQSGVSSESWSVYDNRENGWLAFSDYGTYQPTGSIGFPNNRDGSVHGYTGVNANPGILNPADKIISTMFNQNSKPGAAGYVPGINYLGKGNYLFSYDPASGMYSYDCASNAAVYQQNVKEPDKSRFYVYKNPLIYNSDGVQHDFFPLNVKPDNDKFKLDKENGNPNYWFGMDFTMDFWLPDNSGSGGNKITDANGDNSPMIFEFEGDDDMWVLIDGKLVLDIGGIHDPVEGTINFSTGEVIVKNENGAATTSIDFTAGDHTMEIYYLERGGDKSNCTIKFNLLPEYEVEEPGIDTVKIVKEWVGNPPTMPAEITVELYDENNPKDVIKTATLAPDEEGNWSHSFSNLPHKNAKDETIKYSVREKNSNPNFQVNVDGEVHVYSNAWVFTDQAGLKNEKYVVIGNGKGQVLSVDLKAHDVAKMDKDNDIIIKLTEGDANPLLWAIEPATSYPGGKHFYLKNGDQYLCIKLPDSARDSKAELHLHDKNDATQPSVFYLNASGDLQDATTGHRLVAANGGFGVNTNVGGNVTVESANKASLYVLRESETTAYSFTITNTYVDPNVPMGTLQISKTIGGNAANADDEFTFLVTLKDANGSLVTGTFDKYQFINGQCEVTLTGGKSVSMLLPAGANYTVTEKDANGYELITPASNKYEGTIKLNETAKCPFHNEKNLYTLTVSKSVSGNAADTTKAFPFTVTLTDAAGKALSGTFGEYTFDANGQCTVSIAHGQSFTIKELPVGTKYTVSENSDGYIQTAPATKEATGTITTGENKVAFTNVRNVVRLVKVTEPTGLTVAPTVTVTGSDGSVVTAEALTANNAAKYLEIPVKPGVTYTVAESGTDIPGYAFAGSTLTPKDADVDVKDMTFTVAKNDLEAIPVLTLTNTYAQGGLTVSKNIGGNAADKNDEFLFTVTLSDKDGKAVSGTFGEDTFTDGQFTFTLKGGESKSFADLPISVTYTVTEEAALGYVQTAPTVPATGVISTDPALVSFTNVRWAVDIEKVAIGLNGTDTVAPKVTVGDFTIKKLPAGGTTKERIFVTPGQTYAVTEENAEVPGYTLVSTELNTTASDLTVNGMGFTLADTSTSIPMLTLTNTYAQGGLTVFKTIKGNAADKNDEFLFTVTLSDKDGKAVSGTFGTHTFDANGQCKITLKGGESKSFADLPIGVTYTVTESPALGYVQTAPTAPATGVITTDPALVSFTNVRDVVRLVKVTDPTGLTVAPKVTVTGSDGSVVTAEALTANNAAKYLEIPVKPGVTYSVAESGQKVAGYTFTSAALTAKDADVTVTGMTFTVAKSGMTTVPVLTLTNSYTLDSVAVTIRKVSTGLADGIAYPAPKVSIYAANSTTPVWTGTLVPNGSALPVKLQPGTYTVKEVIDEVEGYDFTSVLYVNDAASTDKTFTLAANAVNTELRLDNFYAAEFSTLTLTKTVTGESGSKTGFSFRITLTDDAGKPLTKSFPYTGTLDGTSPISGVVTSGSTVALRDGGSITVQLPLGVHYQVEEQEQAGYVLVSSKGEKGVITKDGAKAAFVNKPQYTVTVTKVWEGDTAETRPASVQVQLMLSGKPVGDPVTLSAANGWKHTYTDLDAKGPYTIDELTVAEGYVSTVEEGEGNTFVITNSYIVIPPTGDTAHPALYLLALAGSAALLMLLRKRKAA